MMRLLYDRTILEIERLIHNRIHTNWPWRPATMATFLTGHTHTHTTKCEMRAICLCSEYAISEGGRASLKIFAHDSNKNTIQHTHTLGIWMVIGDASTKNTNANVYNVLKKNMHRRRGTLSKYVFVCV